LGCCAILRVIPRLRFGLGWEGTQAAAQLPGKRSPSDDHNPKRQRGTNTINEGRLPSAVIGGVTPSLANTRSSYVVQVTRSMIGRIFGLLRDPESDPSLTLRVGMGRDAGGGSNLVGNKAPAMITTRSVSEGRTPSAQDDCHQRRTIAISEGRLLSAVIGGVTPSLANTRSSYVVQVTRSMIGRIFGLLRDPESDPSLTLRVGITKSLG
jgi:hypothetical protein